MTRAKPCAKFTKPEPGAPYPAYCARCHFSRLAHYSWEQWENEANR